MRGICERNFGIKLGWGMVGSVFPGLRLFPARNCLYSANCIRRERGYHYHAEKMAMDRSCHRQGERIFLRGYSTGHCIVDASGTDPKTHGDVL